MIDGMEEVHGYCLNIQIGSQRFCLQYAYEALKNIWKESNV